MEDVILRVKELEGLLGEMVNTKLAGNFKDEDLLQDKLSKYDVLTRDIVTILNEYTIIIDKEWMEFTRAIKIRVNIAIILISLAFGIAALLSGVFGFLISRSLVKPTKAIIGQIKALSSGEINLTKKLDVVSKDELGVLSNEFNKLMDTIEHVTSYKKVIEEDYTVEDVYPRLADVFKRQIGLDNFLIYEVSNSKNTMKVVYPLGSAGSEIYCNRDTQIDCNLCRAKKTGHIISSLEYPDICRQFLYDKGKEYVCVPLIMGGSTGGVVQFVFDKHEEGFSQEAVDKKVSKARQYIDAALPVIEAKRLQSALRESSLRDTLTGLHNRRFLEEYVEPSCQGF